MANVLSLKSLRDSNTLKLEIRALEDDKQKLLDQIEGHKRLEQKLRDDILEKNKDFEHLEKQFDHFADIETDYETLQSEIQLERLELMIGGDKKDTQHKSLLKKTKDELKAVQNDLIVLKKLDPTRLKRQVNDLKKKALTQSAENKTVNSALVSTRKELKEMTVEKNQLDTDFKAAQKQTDFFWQSTAGDWLLFETGLILKEEKAAKDEDRKRVLCLNTLTGVSVVSSELGSKGKDKDLALWLGEIEVPADVSKEAGKRLKKIASETEEEEK